MCQTAFALVPACDEHGIPSRLSGRLVTNRKSSMSPSALTGEPETGIWEVTNLVPPDAARKKAIASLPS